MAFVENSTLRQPNSVTFEDNATGIRRLVASIAPLHYQDANGDYQRVDMTPVRIAPGDWARYPGFDGWLVQANGYLFGLGVDGWVYFGGRRGEHYVRFRLASGGYYDTAANQWHAIAATPTYSTANLSKNTVATTIEGVVYHTKTVAEWRNLFTTPGGGEVWLRFVVTGGRLKSEYVMNQAARAWITANRPPEVFGISPVNAQFGFRFEMDWSDIPVRKVAGAVVGNEFDDSAGGVELRNALDELLAFMPVDSIFVEQADFPIRTALPQRKRFAGNALYMGAPATQIGALPAGDLVFDPTITTNVAAGADDWAWITSTDFSAVDTENAYGYYSPYRIHNGLRFTNITVPAGATITACYATLVAAQSLSATVSALRVHFVDADNPTAATNYTNAEAQPLTTAYASWTPGAQTAGTGYNTPSLVTPAQAVFDRAGWASGQAVIVVIKCVTSANSYRVLATYEHATDPEPQLYVDYNAGTAHALAGSASLDFGASGGLALGLSLAGSTSLDFTASGTLSTNVAHALGGTAALDFSATGGVVLGLALAGSTSLVFAATGSLTTGAQHALEGNSALAFGARGC